MRPDRLPGKVRAGGLPKLRTRAGGAPAGDPQAPPRHPGALSGVPRATFSRMSRPGAHPHPRGPRAARDSPADRAAVVPAKADAPRRVSLPRGAAGTALTQRGHRAGLEEQAVAAAARLQQHAALARGVQPRQQPQPFAQGHGRAARRRRPLRNCGEFRFAPSSRPARLLPGPLRGRLPARPRPCPPGAARAGEGARPGRRAPHSGRADPAGRAGQVLPRGAAATEIPRIPRRGGGCDPRGAW